MNMTRITAAAVWMVCSVLPAVAQTSATPAVKEELNALVGRIQQKLRAGEKSAAQLAAELEAFKILRAKYADSDPQAAGLIIQREYTLYRDVIRDAGKAAELRTLLGNKYRSQIQGTRLAQEIEMEEQMEQAKAAQTALIGKPAPELNFTWSTDPKLKRLSDLKGKVVIMDFWATWCGPCIATFPQIRELTDHYKGSEVIVLGVTSVQGSVSGLDPARIDTRDNPQKEFALTADFIKAKNMTWPVVFTEQPVFNPDYGVRGIPHVAIIAPDGTVRYNGLHPGSPPAEKHEKVDALLKEFSKKVPTRAAGE